MRKIVVIAHDMRSIHNVGSLLRTAEGLGVEQVYLTGYSPYPKQPVDNRLPHMITKVTSRISKTALGAESYLGRHEEDINMLIKRLKADGYSIVALEQNKDSIKITDYYPPEKIAIVLGREVEGIEQDILEVCDSIVEIPMYGKKESHNVVQATAMILYHVRFMQ